MKNRALAILFGLMPGAGHMYLGKMKRGMTLMLLFWGDLFVASFLGMGVLALGMLVVWFYAFFDNLNLSSLSPQELAAAPDLFLFGLLDGTNIHNIRIFKTKSNALGWGFIIVGVLLLYNTLSGMIFGSLFNFLESIGLDVDWLWQIYYSIPQLVVACWSSCWASALCAAARSRLSRTTCASISGRAAPIPTATAATTRTASTTNNGGIFDGL